MNTTAIIHESNEKSPYRSPTASAKPDAPESTPKIILRAPFRWRLVPVTALHLYGGSLIFVALLTTIHMVVWSIIFIHRGWGVKFSWATGVLRGSVVGAVLGLLVIFSARDFWQCRWLSGTLKLTFAVILYAVFAALGGRLVGI